MRGAALLLGAVVMAAAAQAQPAAVVAASGAATTRLQTGFVRTGLYVISGGGSNSLLRFTSNGSILVDGKTAGDFRALMSQVRRVSRLSDAPVRALLVTDHHAHHAGSNAQFLAAGVAVVAQVNAGRHGSLDRPTTGKVATPVITYEREHVLRLGGVEVQVKHFGPAHTDNDAVVLFPDLRVVAVGDLFTTAQPEPDFAAGGSLVHWATVLAEVLKLDFDTVVPGDGPIVTRAELEAFRARIDTVVARARALVDQGVGKDRLMARLQTDDLGWRFDFGGTALDRFHAELTRSP